MNRQNLNYGTFVIAGLHSQHLRPDTHLSKVNRDIKRIFKLNGLVEGRKMTFREKLRQIII